MKFKKPYSINLVKADESTKVGKYVLITSISQAKDIINSIINSSKIISIDVETSGLNFFRDTIMGLGFSNAPYTGYFIPLKCFPELELLYDFWKRVVYDQQVGVATTYNVFDFSDRPYFKLLDTSKDFSTLFSSFLKPIGKVILADPIFFYKKVRSKEFKSLFSNSNLVDFWGSDQLEIISLLKSLLSSNLPKTGHNIKFDLKFLKFNGFEVENIRFDSMLSHYLLDENSRHNLTELSLQFDDLYGYTSSTEIFAGKGKNANYSLVPLEVLGKYCAIDCDASLRLSFIYRDALKRDQRLYTFFKNFYIPLTYIFADLELAGIRVDIDRTKELRLAYSNEMDEISTKINAIALANGIDTIEKPLNLNSSQQKSKLLFDKLKYPVISRTPTGNPSTSKENLIILRDQYSSSEAELMLRYAFLSKMVSTYLNVFINESDDNWRIHTSYKLHGTETGRLSSSSPSIQTIPRDGQIKSLLVASPNHQLLVADYSQMELRILAWYSQDLKLLESYTTGVDIHILTASLIFNISYDDVSYVQRAIGKTINFAIVYGATPRGLAETINNDARLNEHVTVSISEAEKFIDSYFKAYPAVAIWINKIHSKVFETGYVENVFGRKRRFPQIAGFLSDFERGEIRKWAVNAVIQGTASDVCNFATIKCINWLKENNYYDRVDFVMNVHDAVVFDIPIDLLDKVVDPLIAILEDKIDPIDVPLRVDYTVSNTLYAKEDSDDSDDSGDSTDEKEEI